MIHSQPTSGDIRSKVEYNQLVTWLTGKSWKSDRDDRCSICWFIAT